MENNKINFKTIMKKENLNKIILIVVLLLVAVLVVALLSSKADNATTSLEIQNTPPNTPTSVAETVASTAANPTNEGTTITISGSATDDNGDQWNILVCKTPGISGTDCDGEASDRWCVSSVPQDSGSTNSCDIPTTGVSAEDNDWYVYACDSSSCSTNYSQGSGDSGTPFVVNHAPTFTIANNSPKDPGATVTFTATAIDSDVYTTQDTMTLYICKTNSTTDCVGGNGSNKWCSSSATSGDAGNSVSVTCDDTLASPKPDGDYNSDYYAYLYDGHDFASSSAAQGSSTTVTVSNTSPVVASIAIVNRTGSGELTLDPTQPGGTSTGYKITFTATDSNSCTLKGTTVDFDSYPELIANSTKSNIRVNSITDSSLCDASGEADSDECIPEISCTQDTGSCTGITDSDVTFTCNFSMQYNAKPTAAGSSAGPYDAYKWRASALTVDDDSASSGLIDGTGGNGVERDVEQFLAFAARQSDGTTDLTQISYGAMAAGVITSDANSVNSRLVARGNTGLNQKLYGTDMTCSSGACSGQSISVGAQKYGTANTFDYASAIALEVDPGAVAGACLKPTSDLASPYISRFWKIQVPTGKTAGVYQGVNTILGIVSDYGSDPWE